MRLRAAAGNQGRGCGLILVGVLFLLGSLAMGAEALRLAISGETITVDVLGTENVLVSTSRHHEKRGLEVTMRGTVNGKKKIFRVLKGLNWEIPRSKTLDLTFLPDDPLVLCTSDESLTTKPLLCLLVGLALLLLGIRSVLV